MKKVFLLTISIFLFAVFSTITTSPTIVRGDECVNDVDCCDTYSDSWVTCSAGSCSVIVFGNEDNAYYCSSTSCTLGECDTMERKYCLDDATWSDQDSTEYCSNCDSIDVCGDGKCNCDETVESCREDCMCTRSDHETCETALSGEISCNSVLSDQCTYRTDDKYYTLEVGEDKRVNIELTTSSEGCDIIDDYSRFEGFYIYDKSCKQIGMSEIETETVEKWSGVTNDDIVVKVKGKSSSESCRWDLEVMCEDECGDPNAGCNGPLETMLAGSVTAMDGCLNAKPFSKFILVEDSVGRKMDVKLINPYECRDNELLIYSSCSDGGIIEHITGSDEEKEWTGSSENNIKIEVRAKTGNVHCTWDLEVDIAKVVDPGNNKCDSGENCNSYPDDCPCGSGTECCSSDGSYACMIIETDENNCGGCGNVCNYDDGEICVDGECVTGAVVSVPLKEGFNMISHPFQQPDINTNDCNVIGDIYGDYDSDSGNYDYFSSVDDMIGGYAYWVDVESDCEIIFSGTDFVNSIVLKEDWNMIGTHKNEDVTMGSIKDDCDVRGDVYRHNVDTGNYDVASDSLEPGIGYWIDVTSVCTIN